MKRFLLTMAVLIATVLTAWAQEDVTSTYITNADFSSTEGWTQNVSTQFKEIGNGLIGTYQAYIAPATVDETHLATEYCFGFECRWQTNYSSFTQTTTKNLVAGVYYLSFDVENVNGNTTAANYNNLFYVKVGDNTITDTSTEWMNKGKSAWTAHTIQFEVTEPAPVTISLGYGTGSNNIGSTNTPAIYVSHLKLTYYDPLAGVKKLWNDKLTEAKAAVTNTDYANVTGDEKTALNAEIAKAEPTTADGYSAAAEALSNALSAFTAAKADYDAFAAAKAQADPNLKYASADKKTAFANAKNATPATAAAAKAAADAITTALRAYYESHALAEGVTGAVNATENIKNPDATDSNNGWTWTGNKNNPRNTESWTDSKGKNNYMYFDGGNWGAKGWTTTMEQKLTLPAGEYLLTAKGRSSDQVTLTMSVGAESVALPNVNASGNVFDRGWGDGSVEFLTMGEATITVKATTSGQYQWFSVGDFRLVKLRDATEEELNDAALKDLVAELVNLKSDTKVPTANIGTEAFQYDKTKISAYQEAAKDVAETVDATVEAMKTAGKYNENDLKDMLADMKAKAEAMAVLNAPKEGDKFHVVLTYDRWTYDNKAMTYIANGRTDAGNYNIQYKENANNNLAQAFTFTKVEGNNYKMCQTDNDGNERYITTGQPYGGNANQIRTSTNATDALTVTIIATDKEGVYNIRNTAANNYIGSQDAGVFTVNSHIDFFLKKAEKALVDLEINKDVKYATRIFPFKPTLPEGIKAYACAEFDETTLKLIEVAAPEMNVPYILYAENGANSFLEDWGKGIELKYTEGLLTGVYEDTDAPEGTYVLQNQPEFDGVAFYVVEPTTAVVTVSANRAYLTAPAADAGVKAFRFPAEETTGINAISALTAGKAEIFSVAGARIPSLQKGVNIIRTADGKTTKVLVK